jgi:hypothetical protein
MIVSVISDRYPKPVRNPMGTGMNINFYPRVWSRADIGCNRGYGCERIFAISDPNLIRCHIPNAYDGCLCHVSMPGSEPNMSLL